MKQKADRTLLTGLGKIAGMLKEIAIPRGEQNRRSGEHAFRLRVVHPCRLKFVITIPFFCHKKRWPLLFYNL